MWLSLPKYLHILVKLVLDFQGDLSQDFKSDGGQQESPLYFDGKGQGEKITKLEIHRNWILRWAGFQLFELRTFKEAQAVLQELLLMKTVDLTSYTN